MTRQLTVLRETTLPVPFALDVTASKRDRSHFWPE